MSESGNTGDIVKGHHEVTVVDEDTSLASGAYSPYLHPNDINVSKKSKPGKRTDKNALACLDTSERREPFLVYDVLDFVIVRTTVCATLNDTLKSNANVRRNRAVANETGAGDDGKDHLDGSPAVDLNNIVDHHIVHCSHGHT